MLRPTRARRSDRRSLVALPLALFLVSAACKSGGPSAAPDSTTTAVTQKQKAKKAEGGKTSTDDPEGDSGKKTCPAPAAVTAGAPVEAKPVHDSPRVMAVVYPHPSYDGHPWSQWGQGVVTGGKFWSAIGDHCGENGDAYLYSYDTRTSQLGMVGHALGTVDHQSGVWGYGKIHAQMTTGSDGAVYTATYWGSHTGLTFGNGYDGDLLLRTDPATGKTTSLGVPVPKHGIPSLAASPDGSVLYGEAVDPLAASGKEGLFFAYDLRQHKVTFQQAKPSGTKGYRNILVDSKGRAWYSTGDRAVSRYDPTTQKVDQVAAQLPGVYLRASTTPAPNGTVYGVSHQPDVVFAVTPAGDIRTIGPARGYTTSMAISPDGHTIYYVPDAHGTSWRQGTPVVALDTATGKDRVVVQLDAPFESKLGLRPGGSYDVVLDPSGKRLYVGLNAGQAGSEDTFGTVALAIVDLA